MNKNIITLTDSYKMTHWQQYPRDTEVVYSYFEARTGATFNKTVFFGLQYLLKQYLTGCVVTPDFIESAAALTKAHFGADKHFNREMWEHIWKAHKGYLPVRIRAVAEGTPVPINNVLMTVENTDPKCFALTNHLETLLSHVWGPSTVATLSYEVKKMLDFYLTETADDKNGLPFGLHDFGFRGVNQVEAAGIAGAGHLINFMGTDTVIAMETAAQYYGAVWDGLAYSVPATEHSVMTSLGEEGEKELIYRLLDTYPTGILAMVIDSYDYRKFIEKAAAFKDIILARNGKIVFRPDSGEPTSTTLDVLNLLEKHFGATVNSKGYKQLNSKVGMLWGDGLDYQSIRSILFTMKNNEWATSNIVFGMGGGLLQKINRDTQRFAFKCSAMKCSGHWRDVFKKPLDTSKVSKKGRLELVMTKDGTYHTVREGEEHDQTSSNLLVPVFENGKLLKDWTFAEVRKNSLIK